MPLIDTHCHLDVAVFDADRTAVMQRSAAAGVTDIVVPGISAAGWAKLLALCADAKMNRPMLHPALGLHPLFLAQHQPVDLAALARAVRQQPLIAIGEIGLDFYNADCDPPRQQALFAAQLAIAQEANLPVLLHVRRAHDAALLTLRRFPQVTGIVHAFNGSPQQAAHYLARGFKLGFGGALTFERASKLRRLAAELPLDALVLETDAPDMAGAAHRGERNSPEYLPEVLATLAALRHTDAATLAAATTANARAVLHLP
ncbi:TatD family hydrolase [Chromatium okenii]|uniref:DNAase n=1 Tax=Chromatium okenii TaxID=61644 RepID=A0A2S7XP50_9GAMM|nr:TatD family hydrolase [Chromatium okenii]PQJ95208.1 DNAase [Chromatium okenii]